MLRIRTPLEYEPVWRMAMLHPRIARVSLVIALLIGGGALVIIAYGLYTVAVDTFWSFVLLATGTGGVLAAIGLWRASPETRVNASLAVVTVGATLLAAEIYVGATSAVPLVPAERPDFDTRTPMQVVRDLNGAGQRAVPALFPLLALKEHTPDGLLPLCGISTSTTVFCNESGDYVIYSSDEHGFNNPPGISKNVEIAVLGDSYAQGQCVSPGRDVAGRLRSMGYAAINLGCGGNGPLLELATLVEYALPLRPKVVIWLYYEGNDVADLSDEMRNSTLRRYLDGEFSQKLRDRRDEIDAYWTGYLARQGQASERGIEDSALSLKRTITLFNLRKLLGLRRVDQTDARAALEPVLRQAKALTERIEAKLIFVYLPSWERLHAFGFRDRRTDVVAAANSIGLDVIDLAEVVATDPDPDRLFPFRRIGHFNDEGYALVTETLETRALRRLLRRTATIRE